MYENTVPLRAIMAQSENERLQNAYDAGYDAGLDDAGRRDLVAYLVWMCIGGAVGFLAGALLI